MEKSMTANARPLLCPMCEVYELHSFGRNSARCESCQFVIGGGFLEALLQITGSPEALGSHACECGHPEMRRIPEGVYRCPACGSEVLPLSAAAYVRPGNRSMAYWSGWLEGRYGERACFTENRGLTTWESAEDRLEYYRGIAPDERAVNVSIASKRAPETRICLLVRTFSTRFLATQDSCGR